MHGDDVGVALDQVTAVCFGNGVFGQIETVEFAAFAVDFRLGRVDVFGQFFIRRKYAAAEGYEGASHSVDGKYDSSVVAVDESTVFCGIADAGFFEHLAAEAAGGGCLDDGIAGSGRKA